MLFSVLPLLPVVKGSFFVMITLAVKIPLNVLFILSVLVILVLLVLVLMTMNSAIPILCVKRDINSAQTVFAILVKKTALLMLTKLIELPSNRIRKCVFRVTLLRRMLFVLIWLGSPSLIDL